MRRLAWLMVIAAATRVLVAQPEPTRPGQVPEPSIPDINEIKEQLQRKGIGVPGAPKASKDQLPTPPTAQSVLSILEAEYLTDAERADRRVFHGLPLESDLKDPARRARAAILSGVINDPSFDDPRAAVEDRAEAAFRRGEIQKSIDVLGVTATPRAMRLKAEALEALGKFDEADKALEPLVAPLDNPQGLSAEAVTEGVRGLMLRARLHGKPAEDYNRMLQLLVAAQQDLDRLYWPAMLVQAELLWDKDNPAEAGKAAEEVLTLNPSSGDAWALLGRMGVESFNFPISEQIAIKLDQMARRFNDEPTTTSPDGDLIRARAWMRQNDPDFAEEQIGNVLARYPAHRGALALHCAVTALRYDFDRLEKQLADFDALSPNSPAALLAVGRAMAENRQYEVAAKYLERASARQPNYPAPFIELGLLEMQSGRDDRARTALARACELDQFNVRARNSLKLANELATYDKIETPHFVIRFKPGVDGVMARDMVEPLEEIHRIVCGFIEHEPKTRTTIDLMPDHVWFGVRITGMPAIHTIAASTGPVVAMEAPKVGPNSNGEYDWVRVIRHEYTHTVTLSRTGNRIPHWFTEAAAVYVEKSPRDYNTCQLLMKALMTDSLFDLRQINIAFVRPEKPEDRGQAYAQGHWMYQYMVDHWGASAPLQLMDQYAQGVREATAMQNVLGVTQEQFMADFRVWALKDAATWGMLPTPSISDLRLESTAKDAVGLENIKRAIGEYAALGSWKSMTGSRLGPEWYELPLTETTPEMVEFWSVTHPEHPDVLELLLSDELVANDSKPTPEMMPLMERYAKARPVDPMPHRMLAQMELAAGEGTKAIEHLEYLDAREQYSPTYAVELAKRYAAAGDWEKAWAKALRATRIAPFDPTHRELAATIAIKRGDLGAAEHQIIALTELEPQQAKHKQRLEAVRKKMGEGK